MIHRRCDNVRGKIKLFSIGLINSRPRNAPDQDESKNTMKF